MSCKKCGKPHQTKYHTQIVWNRKWQKENKDKVNARSRKWYTSNRDQVTEIRRKYRKTEVGIEASRRAVRKYEAKNKEKKSAWKIAHKIELKPCEVCGKEPAQRHHPDYSKPSEVIFLCAFHHKKEHNSKT